METRTQEIFKAVVEEYIKHGNPISSGFLAEELGFDASPATLRNELFELEEMGFLEKPHTSAGRVPTSSGYRFFVDNLLTHEALSPPEQSALAHCKTFFQLQDMLASKTHSVVLGWQNEEVREAGFTHLLKEPEFGENDFLVDFMERVERLREDFDEVIGFLESKQSELYIGQEAKPMVGDSRYSVLLAHARDKGFFIFFSPARMDYARALALAEYITH